VWQGEFHNKKKNGESYFEAATISPIRDERKHHPFCGGQGRCYRTKQTGQELKKSMAAMKPTMPGEFLPTGHEIRTPMNSIIGFSRANRVDALLFRLSEGLPFGELLLGIVNDILDFRVEAGKLEVEKVPFQQCGVAAWPMSPASATEKGLVLRFDNRLKFRRHWWATRCARRVNNLLNNAISSLKRWLRFKSCGKTSGQGELNILCWVSRCAIAVSADARTNQQAIQSFSRADASTTQIRQVDGRGDVGGKAPGKGSVFLAAFNCPEGTAPRQIRTIQMPRQRQSCPSFWLACLLVETTIQPAMATAVDASQDRSVPPTTASRPCGQRSNKLMRC
jgi:hypothetical protein